MDFVNKDDDIGVLLNLLNKCLDALFKLSAILGTGHHACQVECDDAFVEQNRAGAVFYNELSQSFNNGTFAHTRLTDEDGVVLFAATENFTDALYFAFTTHTEVEFSFGRSLGKVGAKIVENRRFRTVAGRLSGSGTLTLSVAGRTAMGHILLLFVLVFVGQSQSVTGGAGGFL